MSALGDLRTAEARRMLGLDDATTLPGRARDWLLAGLDSPSLELLAALDGSDPAAALRLLRAAAVELDVTFPTPQAARVHYIDANLTTLTTAEGAAGIPELSNGVTDELTARLRRGVARLFGRGAPDS